MKFARCYAFILAGLLTVGGLAGCRWDEGVPAETRITLTDDGIQTWGMNAGTVKVTNDIIYYEDRTEYESGNPYGEGGTEDRHTAEEAAAHAVINITEAGTYRLTGKLSAGQVRVDLGREAREDPEAVVTLVLDGADLSCSVAPAILFLNVYECDNDWSEDTAGKDVDTSAAGANLKLEANSVNVINGSYVARIYKDAEGEKKLWKQDGAIYSYMSMNVDGLGQLTVNAENEGLDTELHLTINGGRIDILAQNDGINTNEDGVSVTTINDGDLRIIAGLGQEGDGIDSNGWLVINGGKVFASAHPASDAGLDSDMGSYINGGQVWAFGSAMDWAESDSGQVAINLQLAQGIRAKSLLTVRDGQGNEALYAPRAVDESDPTAGRVYRGVILSDPALKQGEIYTVWVDGVQQGYTGTDVMRGPGGFGGRPGGKKPPFPEGERPEPPRGEMPPFPQGEEPTFDVDKMPTFGGPLPSEQQNGAQRPVSTEFYMQDMVNFFSGVTAVQ